MSINTFFVLVIIRINNYMTKYYIPATLQYDRSAILTTLLDITKDSGVDKHGSMVVERVYNDKIQDMLGDTFKNIKIRSILLWMLTPGRSSSIHKDIRDRYEGDQDPFGVIALNLPLQTTELVHMKWFDEKEGSKTLATHIHSVGPSAADGILENGKLPNYIKYHNSPRLADADGEIIDEVYYTTPILCGINTWHSVINKSDTETAIFISIRFYDDSTLENLISKFGPA